MPPISELVIKRSEWGQGALRRLDNGKMCCLGFLSKACGVPDSELFEHGCILAYPRYEWIDKYGLNAWAARLPWALPPSTLAGLAAEINDSDVYTIAEKEEKLTKLFAENGIALTFVD